MHNTIISTTDLANNLHSSNWLIVDTRFDLKDKDLGYKKYLESHIPEAIYADLEKDLSGTITASSGRHPLPSQEKWKQTLEFWGIDNQTQVVVYDDSLGTAARLWWMLRHVGHEKVAVLNGGFNKWQKEKRPISTTSKQNAKTNFNLQKPLADSVPMEYVQQNRENILLIDSRKSLIFWNA